jgi:hypothetical protein
MRTKRIKIAAVAATLMMTVLISVGCRKKISEPFPPSGSVAGWEKGDNTQTFDAANLWQYIDGGAEQYISAGVVSTSTSDYKFQGSLEAVVDVYTMKTATGAKTIFDADPPMDSKPAQLGDAGRLYGQSVLFRKGPYLVRITAYNPAPNGASALMALAHGVEGKL